MQPMRVGLEDVRDPTAPKPASARPGADEGEVAGLVDESTLKERTARGVVTPWAELPYEVQLKRKAEEAKQVLAEIAKCALHETRYSVPAWLQALKGKPVCELENDAVYASPRTHGYRNKVGWTIGYDVNGKPLIGHLLGQTKAGVIAVGVSLSNVVDVADVGQDPADCPNVPPIAEALRLIVAEFVRLRRTSAAFG